MLENEYDCILQNELIFISIKKYQTLDLQKKFIFLIDIRSFSIAL